MTSKKSNFKLFKEFPAVSKQQWEEKISKDLKGADRNKKLIWHTIEGFNIEPYYRDEDLQNIKFVEGFPGEFPYVRGKKIKENNWLVRQDIYVKDVVSANKKALEILMKGVNSLGFIFESDKEITQDDFNKLFENIWANSIEVNFISGYTSTRYVKFLESLVKKRNRNLEEIKGSIDFDPLIYLTLHGKFPQSEEESFSLLRKFVEDSKSLPNFKILSVNGHYFNNAGATVVQELAFSLAVANDYLAKLTDKAITIDEIAPRLQFTFGVGSNYFMEIAKLRAARILWANIVKAYNPSNDNIAQMNIHSVTSGWNKTIYDPYVNMLRTTTEGMSSVIGGADSLTIKPFDEAYKEPDEFSERIARNQQLILKEESYLGKIVDPGAGSYYIENLTESVMNQAWQLFLEIEEKGGYLQAFKKGFIQQQINQVVNMRNMNLAMRREILLGTNQYPDFNEKAESKIKTGKVQFANGNKKIAEPIRIYRGAEAFEEIRLKTEKMTKTPKVFLLTYGNLAMRKARATFALNFFACAGFEVIDNLGFNAVDEGVEAAKKVKADIVVICSSDDEYEQIAPEIYTKLNDKIVVIAGYPKTIADNLKKAGIQHFIHVKSNIIESLNEFQNILKK
ncbi:MAG: methylmalonyl-CoA mutase small subunit [Chlorobi bacterium]|nr:methylmalonyl-CoA mutase small subunit [Chlorobiota bacterium]